jgi:putative serine protease PepD
MTATKVAAMALLAIVAITAGFDLISSRHQARNLALQAAEIAALKQSLAASPAARASAPDWIAIAQLVEPSVVTIETREGLGSGWVAASDASGSSVVTNYHVVAGAWEAGVATVTLKQSDTTFTGTISKVDQVDDLAVVSVHEQLPSLATAASRPRLAQPVMALGSPQGLDGTVATGIVSGYRSLEGSDYIQFSAPISPGNSGGPLVDGEGRVVGVSTAKLVDTGVEALAFAVPVQIVCAVLVSCRSSR